MALTYGSYLRLNELLALQQPQSQGKAPDEMLFIIIHQTYELWFKEMLHEIDHLCQYLESCDPARAQFALKRIVSILKMLVLQMDILETMSAPQFLTFRGLLGSASGFQSAQFRELEFVLGHKQRKVLQSFPAHCQARRRLERRFENATLWDFFLRCLNGCRYPVPEELLHRDFAQPVAPSRQVQAVLLNIYAKNPALANVCELLLDLDEGIQEWRYRHVKLVERILGSRRGTGGSMGVEYLKSTLFSPSFPDLWAIRSEFGHP